MLKKSLLFVLSLFIVLNAYGQAQASYNAMQYATGGIIQFQAQAMGYAANDPRINATLYAIGKTIVSTTTGAAVAAAGTGLLVTATAPAWITAIGGLALTGLISSGVSLGIDALVKWIFGPGPTPVTTIGPAPTNFTSPYQLPSLVSRAWERALYGSNRVDDAQNYISPPGAQWVSSGMSIGNIVPFDGANFKYCVGGDILSVASCSAGGIQPYKLKVPNLGDIPSNRVLVWYGGINYINNNVNFYGLFLFLLPDSTYTYPQEQGWMVLQPRTWNTFYQNWDNINILCPAGSARKQGSPTCVQYIQAPSGSSTVTKDNQTVMQALSDLTAAQKSQKVNYDTMAGMVNSLWQKSASQPGYTGVPYSSTNPVTSSVVQAWATTNPTLYPTVEDLLTPVPDPVAFSPCINGSTCSPIVDPPTPPVTGTAQPVIVVNKVSIDWGIDPNVGAPTLESTPTASSILSPILSLFPSFKNFSVPGHTATCPTPLFDVFGKHFVMDYHCSLFEGQRANLYSIMLLAFSLIAIFIVLSA
jgi:hypothetical protein